MKTVTVTLSGQCIIWWNDTIKNMDKFNFEISDVEEYDSGDFKFSEMESDDILDMDSLNEIHLILEDVKLEVDGKLIIKKGKYIKTREYLSKLLKTPSYMIGGVIDDFEDTYTIELEDNEEFDPMKLQLVKTDYEVECIPYGIITDYIVYDGKEISSDYNYEYLRGTDRVTMNHTIDYKLPFGSK